MGKTLHERVPLKGKHGFASAGWTLAWLALITGLVMVIVQTLE